MLKDLDPAKNAEFKALIDKETAHEQDENQPALTSEEAAKLSDARKAFEDAKAKYLSEGFSNAQLAARQAYDALATEEEKAQVTNYSLLEAMEENIAYIMQAVNTLPAEVKQPEVDYPTETCTVNYLPHSSFIDVSVEKVDPDKRTSDVKLVYTIKEGASGDQILTFDQIPDAYINDYQLPGDSAEFTIEIRNESGKTYRYKPGSFTFATADTSGMENIFPVLGYDGQLLPLSYVSGITTNKALQALYDTSSVDLSLEQILGLYDQLKQKGYNTLTEYFLKYYEKGIILPLMK